MLNRLAIIWAIIQTCSLHHGFVSFGQNIGRSKFKHSLPQMSYVASSRNEGDMKATVVENRDLFRIFTP